MNPASPSVEQLIQVCVESGDAAAWQEFVRLFHPVIAGTVARTAHRFREASPQLIDDLVQETYLKICANQCRILREFTPRGPDSIFGLLKTVAFSVAHDHFRHQLAARRDSGKPDQPLDESRQGGGTPHEHLPPGERKILLGQIDRYLKSGAETPHRDRSIFWLHYRQGLTGREIAAIPRIGLTQKGVESVIQRLTSQVRAWLVEESVAPKGKSSGASL